MGLDGIFVRKLGRVRSECLVSHRLSRKVLRHSWITLSRSSYVFPLPLINRYSLRFPPSQIPQKARLEISEFQISKMARNLRVKL